MMLLDKIIKCEQSYSGLTSTPDNRGKYIIYRDYTTPEMPLQNYLYIKRTVTIDEMRMIVESEKQKFSNSNEPYIRFVFDPYVPYSAEIPELSEFHFTTYSILTLKLKNTDTYFAHKNCYPITIEDKDRLNILYKKLNKEYDGLDKHISRWIDIKLENENMETIVYSENNNFLGNCELFISGSLAKLDDLEVIKEHRNKKVGESLLKSAISICKSKGINDLYLIADNDDWVFNYYQKRGFSLYTEYNSCILYR